MKLIFFISFFSLLSICSSAQKERLQGDTSRFLCKSDSIYFHEIAGLVDKKVDGIVTLRYDYFNGRVKESKSYIFWRKDSLQQMHTYGGCDSIVGEALGEFPVNSIFNLYKKLQVDTVNTRRRMKSQLWVSNSMGYFVTIYLPGKTQKFRVTESNLFELNLSLQKDSKEYLDPRSLFVNSILNLVTEKTNPQ